jgi:hypothetical protein
MARYDDEEKDLWEESEEVPEGKPKFGRTITAEVVGEAMPTSTAFPEEAPSRKVTLKGVNGVGIEEKPKTAPVVEGSPLYPEKEETPKAPKAEAFKPIPGFKEKLIEGAKGALGGALGLGEYEYEEGKGGQTIGSFLEGAKEWATDEELGWLKEYYEKTMPTIDRYGGRIYGIAWPEEVEEEPGFLEDQIVYMKAVSEFNALLIRKPGFKESCDDLAVTVLKRNKVDQTESNVNTVSKQIRDEIFRRMYGPGMKMNLNNLNRLIREMRKEAREVRI